MRWVKYICLVILVGTLCWVVPGPASADSGYDGNAAAHWALEHAQDVQPNFSGCTWFASQALWAGGMKQDDYWNSHNLLSGLKSGDWGSRTATLAQDLYTYLNFHTNTLNIPLAGPYAQYDRFGQGKSAVPEARPGDLIAYDWKGDGVIDHMAVVVRISPGNYPDVAEWGTNPEFGMRSPYVLRGWTWSENQKKWLREENPQVAAYLLRIAP